MAFLASYGNLVVRSCIFELQQRMVMLTFDLINRGRILGGWKISFDLKSQLTLRAQNAPQMRQ